MQCSATDSRFSSSMPSSSGENRRISLFAVVSMTSCCSTLYDEEDVNAYVTASIGLRQAALDPVASVDLISRLAEEEDTS